MSLAAFHNIGAFIKTLIHIQANAATAEVDGAAIAVNGPGANYQSAQIALALGAPTGSPSAVSVTGTVQDSPDGSTGWATINASVTSVVVAAGSTQATANVDIRGSRGYIRVAAVPTFTGGSSPAIPITVAVVLGGTDELPAT